MLTSLSPDCSGKITIAITSNGSKQKIATEDHDSNCIEWKQTNNSNRYPYNLDTTQLIIELRSLSTAPGSKVQKKESKKQSGGVI